MSSAPFLSALLLVTSSQGALPPGYEDVMHCPPSYCSRRVDRECCGPRSGYVECYDSVADNVQDEIWEGSLTAAKAPDGWVPSPPACTLYCPLGACRLPSHECYGPTYNSTTRGIWESDAAPEDWILNPGLCMLCPPGDCNKDGSCFSPSIGLSIDYEYDEYNRGWEVPPLCSSTSPSFGSGSPKDPDAPVSFGIINDTPDSSTAESSSRLDSSPSPTPVSTMPPSNATNDEGGAPFESPPATSEDEDNAAPTTSPATSATADRRVPSFIIGSALMIFVLCSAHL